MGHQRGEAREVGEKLQLMAKEEEQQNYEHMESNYAKNLSHDALILLASFSC